MGTTVINSRKKQLDTFEKIILGESIVEKLFEEVLISILPTTLFQIMYKIPLYSQMFYRSRRQIPKELLTMNGLKKKTFLILSPSLTPLFINFNFSHSSHWTEYKLCTHLIDHSIVSINLKAKK